MKKKHILLLCAVILLLILSVVLFNNTKYICRVPTHEDISRFEEIETAETKVPFINDSERDKLLDKIVHREVKTFNDPITIEIENWSWVMCEGKETLWYTLNVRDADGFITVFTVIIQSRW